MIISQIYNNKKINQEEIKTLVISLSLYLDLTAYVISSLSEVLF